MTFESGIPFSQQSLKAALGIGAGQETTETSGVSPRRAAAAAAAAPGKKTGRRMRRSQRDCVHPDKAACENMRATASSR